MDVSPPSLPEQDDRLSTMVHAFLADGTGAGVGLLGAMEALGLLDDESGAAAAPAEHVPSMSHRWVSHRRVSRRWASRRWRRVRRAAPD